MGNRGKHRARRQVPRQILWQKLDQDQFGRSSGVGAARCIGRVGALAVALGIGVAVAGHPGLALAAPETGAASNAVDGGPPSSPTTDSVNSDTETPDTKIADGDVDAEDAGDGNAGAEDSEGDVEVENSEVENSEVVNSEVVDSEVEDSEVDAEADAGLVPDVEESTVDPIDPVADGSDASDSSDRPVGSDVKAAEEFAEAHVSGSADDRPEATETAPIESAARKKREDSGVATISASTAASALAPITAAASAAAVGVSTADVSSTSAFLRVLGVVAPANSPPAPANSFLLGLFAWVRRQFFNTTPSITRTQPDVTDSAGNVTLTFAETDVDGDRLVYSVTGGTKGVVTLNQDGHSVTYDPGAGAAGTDTFTVRVTDKTATHSHGFFGFLKPGGGHTAAQVVTVTIPVVAAGNRAPVADGAPTVGTPDSAGVVTGDLRIVDPEGAPLTYLVTTDPVYGSVVVDQATGVYTYTPNAAARLTAALSATTVEQDSFVISVSDQVNAPVSVSVTNVLVAELVSNTVIATPAVGSGPRAVAISPDGTYAYVANADDDSVTVLNLVTGETITTITGVGDQPVAIAISPDGTRIYTANSTGQSVGVIQNNIVVDVIAIGAEPTGIAVSADGARIYTTNANSTITIITAADRGMTVIPVDPSSIVFNSAGTVAYALNSVDEIVTVLDTSGGPNNGAVLGTVAVGSSPSGIAIHPNGAFVYVTNTGDDNVTVIRTADYTVVRTVDVGDQPNGIDITPDGTRLYVANFGSDSISIINTVTYAVTDIAVSNGPFGIDIDATGTRATVTHVDDGIVTVLLLAGNAAPETDITIGAGVLGGIVAGTLGATDSDGDSLSYKVIQNATQGSVALDAQGRFTFTPVGGAGSAAAATPGRDFDMFTVEIDDGRGGVIERTVTVEIQPTGVIGTVSAPGSNGSWALSPDGTRTVLFGRTASGATRIVVVDSEAGIQIGDTVEVSGGVVGTQFTSGRIVVTSTGEEQLLTQVAIFDLHTGAQVGETISLAGLSDGPAGGGARLDATGTHAVLAVISPTGQALSTAIIDVITGRQLGDTFTLNGEAAGFPQLDPTGTRVVIRATDGENNLTRVAVLDVATGQQVGSTVTLVGYQSQDEEPEEGSEGRSDLALTADGTRAVLVTHAATGPQVVRVSIVDLATGAQIGSPVAVNGDTNVPLLLGPGRAVLTSYPSTGPGTRLTVIDTGTGTQIGATVALTGDLVDTRFAAGGTRITVVTGTSNSTQVIVIDAATGAQLGTPLSLSGRPSGSPRLVAGGDRLVVTTAGGGLSLTVIDTGGGSRLGSTLTFAGQVAQVQYTADGSRAAVAMDSGGVTTVSVVDTYAGTVLGSPVEVGGTLRSIQLTADGSRAVVTLASGAITQIAIIDVQTGLQLGDTSAVSGAPSYNPAGVLGPNGTLAVVNTVDTVTGRTRSAIVDLTTGTLIADGVVLDGQPESGLGAEFSPDGSRVAVFTVQFLPSGENISRAAVLDTATGAQIGDTIVLTGYSTDERIQFNADGSLLLLSASSYNPQTNSVTSRVVVVRTDDGSQVGDTLVFESANEARFTGDGDRAVVVTDRDGTVAVSTIAFGDPTVV